MTAVTMTRIKRSLRGCRFKMSFGLCLFEDGFCFDLFGFLIALPFMDRWCRAPKEMMESWRVYWDRDNPSIVWCWGDYCKFFHMPWGLKFHSNEVLRADGTWSKFVPSYSSEEPDGRHVTEHEYTYTLRSGEIQKRIAKVYVKRMEWRRKWSMWTSWFGKKRTSIAVEFNDEVGERTGSWKGGCIGCGYELKPGETAQQCLRRMESERVFD